MEKVRRIIAHLKRGSLLTLKLVTAKYLQPLMTPPTSKSESGDDWPTVEVLGRAKDEAQNKSFFERIVEEVKQRVGCYASSDGR